VITSQHRCSVIKIKTDVNDKENFNKFDYSLERR